MSAFCEMILETIVDGLAVVDFEGQILFVNDSLVKMTHYSRAKLLTLYLSQITIGEEFTQHLINSARKNQEIINFETTIIPQDSPLVPVEISSKRISDEDRILIVFRDQRAKIMISDEIKAFQLFSFEHTRMSLFKYGSMGAELVISEQFPTELDDQVKLLSRVGVYYMIALAQGSDLNTGLYGPLPLPRVPNHVSLVFSFFISDLESEDPRTNGHTYALLVLTIPEALLPLLNNRTAIQRVFSEELRKVTSIQEITLATLEELKQRIMGFSKNDRA
ncbi:MAG: PAS domain-containing protein [Candidatus Hodarchaeota archaeon]